MRENPLAPPRILFSTDLHRVGLWFAQGVAVGRNCLEPTASASMLLISMWLGNLSGLGGYMLGGLPGALLGGLGGAAVGELLGDGFGYGHPCGYGPPFGYAFQTAAVSSYTIPYQLYSPGIAWEIGQGVGWGMNRGIGWGNLQRQGYMMPYGYSMPLFKYY